MMKRWLRRIPVVVGAGVGIAVSAGSSFAALTFPTISTTDVETIAAGMLGLMGTVWALKKAINFLRA